MIDIVSQATRSRMMASIRGKDTRPEMIVRRFLHGEGFRYRLHVRSLPGCPDLVLPKYRLAIFIHGCFWHQHAGCRYAYIPDQNREKWRQKLAQNITRDQRNVKQLMSMDWKVIVIWECCTRTKASRTQLTSLPALIRYSKASVFELPPNS